MFKLPRTESASRVTELEWPEEIGGLFEIWANRNDFMDQVLHADDPILAQIFLNQRVVSESNALLVDLAVATLVDEFADALDIWVSIGNPWLDDFKHLQGSFSQADEDTIVDLKEAEKLKDLAGLRSNLIDTGDSK